MDRDRVLPNFIFPPGIYRRASRAPLCDPLCADWWRPLSSPQICYTQSLDRPPHYEGDSTLKSANDKRDKLKGRSPKKAQNLSQLRQKVKKTPIFGSTLICR